MKYLDLMKCRIIVGIWNAMKPRKIILGQIMDRNLNPIRMNALLGSPHDLRQRIA
jgi:hypothetical protein